MELLLLGKPSWARDDLFYLWAAERDQQPPFWLVWGSFRGNLSGSLGSFRATNGTSDEHGEGATPSQNSALC